MKPNVEYLEDMLVALDCGNSKSKKDEVIISELLKGGWELSLDNAKEVVEYWREVYESRHTYVLVWFRTIPIITFAYYVKDGSLLELNHIKFYPKSDPEKFLEELNGVKNEFTRR